MSFSYGARGNAEGVRKQVGAWADQQAKLDESLPDGTKVGHQVQLATIAAAVDEFTEQHPDQYFSVQGSGHANPDGTGNVSVNISNSKTPPA